METISSQPLVIVRDYLRLAQDVLIAHAEDDPSPELDAVLNDLVELLLKLKAVGSDARWAE